MKPQRADRSTEPTRESPEEPEDEALVDGIVVGEARAFERLVERWGARVRDYLARVAGDADAADDLLQEVLFATFRSAAARDRGQPFRVWLFSIARNAALSHLRKRSVRGRLLHVLASAPRALLARFGRRAEAPPPDALIAGEFEQAFAAALARLPEEFRTAFLLREREELTYEEIAAIVGVPAKTVSTRLVRAREKLRRELQEWIVPRGEARPGRRPRSEPWNG
jgi:RNA polymerase sigma-70 factor (ECF subfamily)